MTQIQDEDRALTGGCYCGAVRFEVRGPIVLRVQCYCRACQHISGGAPQEFMLVGPDALAWTRGTPNSFTRPDKVDAVTRHFCATCGTHLATRRPGLDYWIVKVGALDDPDTAGRPSIAIFTAEAAAHHIIPETLRRFPGLPPSG